MNNPDLIGCLVSSRGADAGRLAPSARPGSRRRGGLVRLAGLGLALAGIAAGVIWARSGPWQRVDPTRDLPRTLVARVDLGSRVTASGRVESSRKTIISCELERLEIRSEGRAFSSSGASTVLEVIPDGAQVKKGDVLCRLDSSEYEELVRTQQIKTEQSKAALEQAKLNFDVAELAVREFRDGLAGQSFSEMEGEIVMAESDLERAGDRLRWTEAMLKKGYAAVAQKTAAERTQAQIRLRLLTSRWDLANFRKFGNPKMMKELLSEVEKRRYEVVANTQQVSRLEERLAHYKKMVERCTILAPQDGLLIHAVDPYRRSSAVLQAGVQVRQQQPLFYLPDLSRMEVVTYLHESVAERVQVGLPARARIEGLANRTLEGHVAEIMPLPVSSPTWTTSDEVKYFIAVVRLNSVPRGMLPGMSAEVEIEVDRGLDVLAVPTEAVAYKDGRDICYVAGPEGLQRRQITLGRSNTALLEVTRGLAEGESVITNPGKVEAIDSLVVTSPQDPDGDGIVTAETPGSSHSPAITVE